MTSDFNSNFFFCAAAKKCLDRRVHPNLVVGTLLPFYTFEIQTNSLGDCK